MAATADRKKSAGSWKKKANKQPKMARKSAANYAVVKSRERSSASKLREKLHLTQSEFAGLLPASIRTVATLEQGEAPSDTVARRLTELERLTKALAEVIRVDSIGKWLKTPNKAFGDLKPLEVIDRGESDRLWEMIYFLRSGVAS